MGVNGSNGFGWEVRRLDRAEFSRRVLKMEDRLYRVSFGILRDEQDRRDAAQEAVLRAWAGLDKLRRPEYFETWLTRILIRCCYDILKARGGGVPLDDVPEPAAPEMPGSELREAIRALEPKLRLPLVLHYVEGYKLREIARMLKIPENTVATRLHRAREKLREQLMEEGFR